jgi:flagellar basal-body rod protein FlgB
MLGVNVMLVTAMNEQNDILAAALRASAVRNDVMVNNLANADVPGYKAKTVDFEASLTDALKDFKRTGELDLSGVKAMTRSRYGNMNYRIDENDVDVEMEMVNLYQNSVKYEAMVNCVLNNSKRLNLAATGR